MSIMNLVSQGIIDAKNDEAKVAPSKTSALAFVFDSSFLTAFKVLIFSMAKTGSLLDVPVLVYTQDEVVFNDPIVNIVADVRLLIDDNDIKQFSVVSSRRIPSRYKLEWIPKYTFLKWMIFDDHQVDQLLFVDSDIVCLNRADDVLSDETPGDLIGCPRFMESLFQDDGGRRLSEKTIFRNVRNMIRGKFDSRHTRLNSGVLLLRDKVLSASFRESLLKFAENKEFVNEQSYITSYFQTERDCKMSFISSKYNFGAGVLANLPVPRQLQLLKDIVFLHFPGPRKPWLAPLTDESRFSHMIWRKLYSDCQIESELFGKAESGRRPRRVKISEADM